MGDPPLYLFAKAPVAGRVKRRLEKKLESWQSAQVATAMLEHMRNTVEQGWPGRKVLNAAPDLTHPAFEPFTPAQGWSSRVQLQSDLGGRMAEALQEGYQQDGAAVVLGTDIPMLPPAVLALAFEQLQAGKSVVGPSQDGGFYLLGLCHSPGALFGGIRWGQADVYSCLMANARVLGVQLAPLPTMSDCDYYDDLKWVVRAVPAFRQLLLGTGFDMRRLG